MHTYTKPIPPIPHLRSTNPKYFFRRELPIAGLLSKDYKSLPPTDLSLKHLVLHEMEIANIVYGDIH